MDQRQQLRKRNVAIHFYSLCNYNVFLNKSSPLEMRSSSIVHFSENSRISFIPLNEIDGYTFLWASTFEPELISLISINEHERLNKKRKFSFAVSFYVSHRRLMLQLLLLMKLSLSKELTVQACLLESRLRQLVVANNNHVQLSPYRIGLEFL